MSRTKIIVVEGPQGAGKTTITNFLRSAIPYTNLYRLSGTKDATPTGKEKSKKMYDCLVNYIESMANQDINLLFDRTFFTEEIYCRLGFKEYQFSDLYFGYLDRLANMDYDIYYITLYLSDTEEYNARLERAGKAVTKYAEYDKRSSVVQQEAYLKMAEEIKEKYTQINVINVDNTKPQEEVEAYLKDLLSWKE